MKRILLAASCLALTSTASIAADLPLATKAPVMAVPVFTWTGCYVGGHVGGGMMTSNTEPISNHAVSSGNGTGALAGGQIGCNYQDGNWVFGLEGEGFWSGIKLTDNASDIVNPVIFTPSPGFTNGVLKNTDDFTIAARVGIAFDRTYIYGKGGWAWGRMKFDSTFTDFNTAGSILLTGSDSFSGTLDGPMFGVGIEHALTRNWTVKFEYDFIAYGNKEVSITECRFAACAVTGTESFSTTKQIFKVGANYLFDIGGASLIAKY
jgi:outer membrane immunogenic protein